MTDNIRTAAQREAEARWPRRDISLLHDADMENHLIRSGFTDGAVWGAARVTPTRGAVLRTIAKADSNDWTLMTDHTLNFMYGAQANAVLALMAGLEE